MARVAGEGVWLRLPCVRLNDWLLDPLRVKDADMDRVKRETVVDKLDIVLEKELVIPIDRDFVEDEVTDSDRLGDGDIDADVENDIESVALAGDEEGVGLLDPDADQVLDSVRV